MEAKELMIGDWVSFNNGNFKSKSIDGYTGTVFLEWNPKYWNDNLHKNKGCVLIESIEHIPLTEDILKANGFERNVLCAGDYYFAPTPDMHDVMFHVSEDDYEDVWHVESIVDHNDNAYALFNVCYVHEMQHILRVCGLTELADNFKVV